MDTKKISIDGIKIKKASIFEARLGNRSNLALKQSTLSLQAERINLADNALVPTWSDTFGRSSATQETTAAQPTFDIDGLNGKPCVDFGVDDSIVMIDSKAPFNLANDFGILASVDPKSFLGVKAICGNYHTDGYGLQISSVGQVIFTNFGIKDYNSGKYISQNTTSVVGVFFNSSNDAVFCVNGEMVTVAGTLPINTTTVNFFSIGQRGRNSSFFNGKIGELFFYKNFSAFCAMEKILVSKYL